MTSSSSSLLVSTSSVCSSPSLSLFVFEVFDVFNNFFFVPSFSTEELSVSHALLFPEIDSLEEVLVDLVLAFVVVDDEVDVFEVEPVEDVSFPPILSLLELFLVESVDFTAEAEAAVDEAEEMEDLLDCVVPTDDILEEVTLRAFSSNNLTY